MRSTGNYEISTSFPSTLRQQLDERYGVGSLMFDVAGRPLISDDDLIRTLEGTTESVCECLSRAHIPGDKIEAFIKDWEQGTILSENLPFRRQLQIAEMVKTDAPAAIAWQAEREMDTPPIPESDLSKPSWLTVATAPYPTVDSEINKGHRVSFAFYKKQCEYRKNCQKGCRFCGLSYATRNIANVTPEQQLEALDEGLKMAHRIGGNFPVFEILPDGSFLNPNEVPREVQIGMMKRLSQEPGIFRVAVETRPEYCNPTRVRRLLENLRPDQQLDLYLGLESTDNFMSAIVNNKGYVFEDVKRAIRTLKATLSEEEMKRINFSVYNIMKPAYVTDQEAIQLSLQMARDVREFSREVGVPIEVSCQPCVISKNTLQNYLYHQRDERGERRYEPLSYFSVAEVIARAYEENPELSKTLKFGQRDDIDIYTVVAMVRQLNDESLFSQFDFMVYNAVQRFNCEKDIRDFLVDIQFAVQNSPEFRQWELDTYGEVGVSSLARLVNNFFIQSPLTPEEIERQDFQKQLLGICDQIEYNENFSNILRSQGLEGVGQVSEAIKETFSGRMIAVKKFTLIDNSEAPLLRNSFDDVHASLKECTEKAAYQVEVILWNEDHLPQSVWVKIPLKPTQLPTSSSAQ